MYKMKKHVLSLVYFFCFSLMAGTITNTICGQFNSSTINTSGSFGQGSDLSLDPQISNTAFFVINTNDVLLDLDSHLIALDPSSTQTGIDGVVINPNLDNIRIRGGIFKNLSGFAIRVGDGCSRITIDHVNIQSCAGGISLEGIPSGTGIETTSIANCLIDSCTGNAASPAFGIHMNTCMTSEIKDCRCNNNDGLTTGSGYGIWLENCSTTEVITTIAYANGGNTKAAGIYLNSCNNCFFNDCRIKQTITRDTAATSTVYGVLLEGSMNNLFQSCKSAGNTNTSSSGIGFCTTNGTANFFSDCNTLANTGKTGIGFLFTGTERGSAVLKSNALESIGNLLSGYAYGILIDGPQNCAILNNIASGNIGAIGIGLRDTATNTNNFIAGNRAYRNTTTGYDVYRTTGAFPVVFASVGDFSNLQNISEYFNLALTS